MAGAFVWLRAGALAALLGAQARPATPPTPSRPAPSAASATAPGAAGAFDWRDAVLYFVVVDRFADGNPGNNVRVGRAAKGAFHGGDLQGLRERLDDIAELGVTALWITPVVKNIDGFVTGAGFPDWAYHGYWADDFTRTDARFGSEEDLKALVEECHRRGIKLLLDVVYNHAGYGSRYLTDPATKG
jgi:glycosidase